MARFKREIHSRGGTVEVFLDLEFCRRRQFHPQLKPAPDGPIEEFGMVCRGDDDDVRWQAVDLQEQGTDDSLYFARFVNVSALFSQRVEFVEKQDAAAGAHEIKEFAKSQ